MNDVLITGGSGTLGKEIVKQLSEKKTASQRFIVYSRSEAAQAEMQKTYPEGGKDGLRYFIGDVRDQSRLIQALTNVNTVIHTAAQKMVDSCEYNIQEAIKTNVEGTINVMEACHKSQVHRAIFISTDKAVYPQTSYGFTKALGEKIFINGNNLGKCRFSVVRYGNVLGSRSSVLPYWKKLAEENNPLPITHEDMTRFFWSIEEAASFVLHKFEVMSGGEIFIPKMKRFKIWDMAKEISDNIIVSGLRPYEKIHETLLTEDESARCFEEENYYTVLPAFHHWCENITVYGTRVPSNFKLTSEVI